MEVTFSEGGRYKFACYRLTYEESKSPDRIAKIKADLASKGKDGYSIAITYDASPTPPTWDTFANSLLCLDGRLEMWKLMQESWPHHKAVEAQKGVSKMSTSYFIFTEVLTNDQWHCINPQVMKLLPIEQLILVPTLRSDSRYQFEKAYRQLECDGHPFTEDEMSRNLQASVNDWLTPEDSVRIAVCYDDILKLLNTSGKEHSAFARTVTSMEAITYLNAFARWPMIEYLVKLKLFRLVRDVVYSSLRYTMSKTINCEGRNLQDVLGFDRSWIPLLQEVNPGIAQLRIIRAFIGAGKKLDASMMKWCADNAVQDASVLTELLSYTSMHKLCRYADAQYEGYRKAAKVWYCEVERSMANLLTDYCDYLRMCKELQYDVKNSFVLFPHMLKDAHDSAAKTLKDKRTAEQEKAIGDSFDEWQKRYQYQSKELMMIPPHSAKEIVDEGAALHHCVGHYLKNVAEKERVILFVRSVAEPDKSLCTVEVKDGQVTQARGFDNAEPPAQITAFIEQWKHRVLYASDKAAA